MHGLFNPVFPPCTPIPGHCGFERHVFRSYFVFFCRSTPQVTLLIKNQIGTLSPRDFVEISHTTFPQPSEIRLEYKLLQMKLKAKGETSKRLKLNLSFTQFTIVDEIIIEPYSPLQSHPLWNCNATQLVISWAVGWLAFFKSARPGI